jgi:hypothetical protein
VHGLLVRYSSIWNDSVYSLINNFRKGTEHVWERVRSVGIGTGYRLDGQCTIPGSARLFSYPQRPDRLWGPPTVLSNMYQGSVLGLKRPGRDADHSPPSIAEAKNGRAIPPVPHMSS